MKKKIFLAVSIIVILAVSVWGCMEVCAAKKPKWETAVVSVKTGAKTLEEESDISASGILQQMAAQAFQDISSLGVLQNETTQYSTTQCTPDYPAMIMVKDVLYQDSGKISTELRCGMMDGSITSVAEGVPTENDQSNFRAGIGYQYGMDSIEVLIDDEWHILIPYDTPSYAPDWESLSEEERMEIDPMYFGE